MEELDSKKAFKVIKNSDFKGLLMINDYFVHRPAHQNKIAVSAIFSVNIITIHQ